MKKCCIEPYGFEIKKLGSPSTLPEKLGAFGGSHSAYDSFLKMLGDIGGHKKLDAYGKTVSVDFDVKNSTQIFGVIKIGEYGYQTDIIDADSGVTTYNKKKSEANPEPYCFYIAIPSSARQGFLMLPRYGGDGIKTIIGALLAGMFASDYQEYRLHINPIVAAEYIRDVFARGEIEEISFEKKEIPSDIADYFNGGGIIPGKCKIIVNPSDKSIFRKDGIVSILTNSTNIGTVFNVGDQDDVSIKVKIKIDGGDRTINLNNPNRMHASYDVTERVGVGVDGYPEPKSLLAEMEVIAADLASRVGIEL